MPHIDDIKSKEFQDIPSYIEHILKNFNQIYKAGDSERIIQGEKAKGLTPLIPLLRARPIFIPRIFARLIFLFSMLVYIVNQKHSNKMLFN